MSDHSNPQPLLQLNRFFSWRFLKQIRPWFRFFILLIIIFGIGLAGIYFYLKSRPLPPPDLPVMTKIYDDQGKLIQSGDGKDLDYLRISEIPNFLLQATLAAEDHTFFQHLGFSLQGIARAAWVNLKSGKIVQGASTITQQLARNLYLTHDRTWARKWKEALLTVQLELQYTKQNILEMYLNHIYYGHGAYGAHQAAHYFFHKSIKDLSLAESAFLAGLPRGPEYYSPYRHFAHAKKRQEHILDLMVKNQMITKQEADLAKQEKLTIVPLQKARQEQTQANYFRDYILKTAINKYGLDEKLVHHGGLKIYTTLNSELQKEAEKTIAQFLENEGDLQGALISVDPHTGHIKAMVGGKNYRTSPYNRAFALRQPGSTFKPILYLTALQNGFTPITKIVSRPTSFVFQNEVYSPTNYNNQYPDHPITMREAIAYSDNIYAVSTLFRVGISKVIETANKLGIKSDLKPTPSLALGSYSITPFELTQAYSTIASGGIYRPIIGIRKIVDVEGDVLFEAKDEFKQVISPSHSYVLTQLLSSVFEPGGTAHRVSQIFPRPKAGKTGSTDWDSWLAGYTPDLVTTVWIGYDRGKKLPSEKARLTQYIWANYMKQATKNLPNRSFAIPENVQKVYIDPETGYRATPYCPQSKEEYFVKGTEPLLSCPLHSAPPEEQNQNNSLWNQIFDWLKKSF
jgi:1A family penicillin-binding protein